MTAVGIDTPPATPALGAAWIVGASPTGAWAGHASALVGWTAGGWRFVAPSDGMAVWNQASGSVARRLEGAWVIGARSMAIGEPAGGAVIDIEARTAIGSILAVLHGQGLLAS